MPLDAILLTALRRELENSLLGAKIDRISMPEKDVLILSVHSREQGSRRVLISVRPGSARISLTEQTMEIDGIEDNPGNAESDEDIAYGKR